MLPYLVTAVAALAVGGALGWLLAGRKHTAAPSLQPLVDELRGQLGGRDESLRLLRVELDECTARKAAAEGDARAARELVDQQQQIHDRAMAESRQAQEKALAELRDAFKSLAADAMKQTHPEFIRLANETLGKFQESAKGDLAQRQQSIATLIEPLKQHLETYQRRLQQAENTQSATLGEVKKQLELLGQQSQLLSSETLQLRKVLNSNQSRGRWGEETLRRVIEAAEMSVHCDFCEQIQAGDGKPDLIVHLPGNRCIIIDSKVPDLDFLTALDTADDVKRAEALRCHAEKLKGTIKQLAQRDYPENVAGSLDYVVLFLPAESLFSAALEGDRDLIVWAARQRIILATPASLIGLLRAVKVSWQHFEQSENAAEIIKQAQELFSRVATFVEHFDKIRTGLASAARAYDAAVGSYERSVLPCGGRLRDLGAGVAGKELASIDPINVALRLPPAPPDRDSLEFKLQ